MSLLVSQEGVGPIILTTEVPPNLLRHIISGTHPLVIEGIKFQCLMQEFRTKLASGWFNRIGAGDRTIITLDAEYSVLELRIAWKNRIIGTWDGKTDGDLPVTYFQMAFVPIVATRALFELPAEYQTFDIHYKLQFLENAGISYRLLDKFINEVRNGNEAVELAPHAYPCTDEMLQLVDIIIRNQHSETGREKMLENHLESILISALEVVSKSEGMKLKLTIADKQALCDIRELIISSCPVYLSNEVLLQKVFPRLNAYKLHYGFKQLFQTSPYELYQRLRFQKAKELLEKGEMIATVAYMMEYDSPNAFIREFKTRFGVTPKQSVKV